MLLANITCTDKKSFKYSLLLYIYYYNIKKNRARVSQLINNINPYIDIKFNENSDVMQFVRDDPHISLFITDSEANPLFFTRNNGSIQVNIVKLDDYRYSLVKPSIKRFMHNVNEINKINKDKHEKYKLTDEIKKDLCLRFDVLNCD